MYVYTARNTDALQVREKEREYVCVLPSLIAHAIGYEMIVGATILFMPRCIW